MALKVKVDVVLEEKNVEGRKGGHLRSQKKIGQFFVFCRDIVVINLVSFEQMSEKGGGSIPIPKTIVAKLEKPPPPPKKKRNFMRKKGGGGVNQISYLLGRGDPNRRSQNPGIAKIGLMKLFHKIQLFWGGEGFP